MSKPILTPKEDKIINGLNETQRTYFDAHFYNIGLGQWDCNLKHYDCEDEPYNIDECIVIAECQTEFNL